MRPLRGIAGRLFLSYLAVVGVGLLVAAVAIGGLLFSYVNDQTRLRLVELATPFQAAIQAGVRDGKQPREIVDGLVEQANAADARLLILGPNGGNALTGRRVLIDTQGSLVNTRFPAPEQGNIGAFTQGSVAWIFIQQPLQRARGSEQAFLADISHELRTPLTSIQGFSQAIVEGEASGDGVTRAAGIIHRESRRLGRMVEGLLQVAKLEAGASEIARDAIDPAALLHAAVGALEMQAHESGVRFEVEAPHLPAIVGDADRLSQLFINVLDNAVKHAPRDTVVVVSAARTGGEIVVRVRDAGPGLPGADPDRLFERFYRSDTARPRDGAGLGLAIASAIAQAHGGRIEARNADTGGAEFVIHLPLP